MLDPITITFGLILGLLAYTYRKVSLRAAVDAQAQREQDRKATARLRANMQHANIQRVRS